MSVDFEMIKRSVKIVDVLARRGISLRYNGEWGSAVCPLPSHKPGDKDRTFQVNTRENYWKCWSKSCNEKAGKKGGDVINLAALLENTGEYAAACRLLETFLNETKTPPHIATGQNIKRTVSNDTSPAVAGKGFMGETNQLLDEWLMVCPEPFRKDLRKKLADRIHLSYLNGQKKVLG